MEPGRLLSTEDRTLLLKLARESVEQAIKRKPLPPVDLASVSIDLQTPGATFVTLTEFGDLRGCIGALEAYQPLVLDVQEHAVAAALSDYRFPPVRLEELSDIHFEISRLTAPVSLEYETADELVHLLRPGIDGVILRDGTRRATFLPQVWEKLPDPEDFLSHLCQKMGAPAALWRRKKLGVFIYQVEEFQESS